ncbi:PHD and RING finger domain-containing protein 1 isoform X2 [Amyelois transitella]|uniref:PHD and RING finger domain-containing protein 1 isoform X2 n=1 Tax=Amyelois transitella TaxID=680683 RepID=UPI00299066FF|nr:PHD and RING finger domain-containing protein 1 isoform X2 [Amyelois transitella]
MSDEGSDDSPPRPKRRIKKVLVLSSESGSDSDESIGATTRRKRLRVVSDAESSSSSGSVVRAGTRHRRTLPKLRDSDADSDSSSGGSTKSQKKPVPTNKPTSGFASDSSEGNSDKCSICLLRFTDQEVGTPETCEHIFCLDCITEWSKNVNTCPVDRITFNSIVVRVCAGGRVLRTEPVKVVERRSSVDLLFVEDPTVCEVCGSTDNEESMLLCDGCDLGYHMQCLVPPLSEVPIDQWLCPNCDDLLNVIHLSEVDDLFSGIVDLDLPVGPRPVPLRAPRNVRRSARNVNNADEPSTSSGRRGSSNVVNAPTTSRSSRVSQSSGSSRAPTRRRTTGTKRRTTKRRSKTVIIEYEVQENGKFPVTKTIRRRLKKRRTKKRQPRTAARRSHVRASVRAKLADFREPGAALPAGPGALTVQRHRAGIPSLSLFGNQHELEYFSEDEGVSEGATTAVVARPTSSIISAYRQARRKMISIPSPPHASSAPDVLSSILESQTLLHSKKSIVSVSVDGNVSIKLETRTGNKNGIKTKPETQMREDKIDLSKAEDTSRKAPSYPGQSRGGGGWGGGYRGNYHREQTGNFRGGYDGGYQGYQPRHPGNNYQQNNSRRDDEAYGDLPRRPHQYLQDDEFDRRRSMPENRPNFPQNRPEQARFGNNWQPYNAPQRFENRADGPPSARHSFGGFENPLDMRTGAATSQTTPLLSRPAPQPYRPLPEPPSFKFDTSQTADVDKSEDERSDPGLVIDTEKYDPTEPTNDDDSGDEADAPLPAPPAPPPPPALPAAPAPAPAPAAPPAVPAAVLDTAVRQVLQEHRSLLSSPSAAPRPPSASDDDSDGDCPNFSIYSATSVHIANNTGIMPIEQPPLPPVDDMQDLVQEDDDITTPEAATPETGTSPRSDINDSISSKISEVKKKEEQYKEKVSKRCPITVNTRNPIKIKLNTPSLIKRRVSLYDDDELVEEEEPATKPTDEIPVEEKQSEKLNESSKECTQNHDEPSDKETEQLATNEVAEMKEVTENSDDRKSPEMDEAISAEKDDENNEDATEASVNGDEDKTPESVKDDKLDKDDIELEKEHEVKSEAEQSDDDVSEPELGHKRERDNDDDRNEEGVEKMTESISDTEDERSYTPCLDENKSKDTSLETEKDKALEGLDTEMISEDEGNEMFSDQDKISSLATPPAAPRPDEEDGEITEKKKEKEEKEEGKKKKKKDSKKEGKEKTKKKKNEVAFKKLSKSGKERNYRERDKDKKKSRDSDAEKKKRKEKRKDLERYDVRTVVTEKRRKVKDPFGRDVSPRRSASPSLSPPRRRSASRAGRSLSRTRLSPSRPRRSLSRPRRSVSRPRRSVSRARRSISRARRSLSRPRRSLSRPRISLSRPRRSPSRGRRSISRPRRSISRVKATASPPRRLRRSPSLRRSISRPRRSLSRARPSASRSATPRASPSPRRRSAGPARRRRRSGSRPRRRRSASRSRKRRRSQSKSPSPKPKAGKRRRRARSERRKSRSERPAAPAPRWSPASVDSRLLSPRTPPPEAPPPAPPRPRDSPRPRHRRLRDNTGPSKEVFTSGDNILVSVSFKDQDRPRSEMSAERQRRRERRRDKKRRKRQQQQQQQQQQDQPAPRPVAIIDLERSPFRELTPEARDVIVLSDSDHGKETTEKEVAAPPPAPAPEAAPAAGPKTPPDPGPAAAAAPAASPPGPSTPPEPPSSPDAYDPFEPTRSASASPARSPPPAPPPAAPAPPHAPPHALPAPRAMTLEAAQKTNMSADDVIDRRPLSPMEKVLQLLQSTRDAPPSPPPGAGGAPGAPGGAAGAGAPAGGAGPAASPARSPEPGKRIVLPEPAKLFLAKPSPIKSDPIKPMQMQPSKISRLPLPRRAPPPDSSPYSPGESDFGELFEPPRARRKHAKHAKVPVKLRQKGKTQVGVKIDEDNLKILDELPSSAVEMQVKSKVRVRGSFLKKLNRQERVVEEVKLVLKPHYNKKHVSKEEYKDILRRAVPKICHNKSGEINPTKIQALVEAYVKKFRKKHKQAAA